MFGEPQLQSVYPDVDAGDVWEYRTKKGGREYRMEVMSFIDGVCPEVVFISYETSSRATPGNRRVRRNFVFEVARRMYLLGAKKVRSKYDL